MRFCSRDPPVFMQTIFGFFLSSLVRASLIYSQNKTDWMQSLLHLFISVRRSTCFRRGFPFIIRSSKLHIQRQACLTLYVQFYAPNDERKNRLKHVERLTEINKCEKICILLVVQRVEVTV